MAQYSTYNYNLSEKMDKETSNAIEAATFRHLLEHLRTHTEVQNIDLMNLADFCRNCLSKWYKTAAENQGMEIDYETARAAIYGMPYSEWKEKHQKQASPEQLAQFNAKHK